MLLDFYELTRVVLHLRFRREATAQEDSRSSAMGRDDQANGDPHILAADQL